MKKLITGGIVAALLSSNVVTAIQYKNDLTKLDQNINSLNQKNSKLTMSLDNKDKLINQYQVDVDTYETKVVKLNSENKKLKYNNDKLKKKLDKVKKTRKELPLSSSNGNAQTYTITYYTSGYESTQKHKGDKGYGLTASGTRATEGRTIAAPKSIPFGTKVYIEGIGVRTVEDRGGAITTGHIDVYVESVNKARELGKQKLQVKILD